MSLTSLPYELLDIIVESSLGPNFLDLAKTCKKIYARCEPFIRRHNVLRLRFRDFRYYARDRDYPVAASDLISIIAADPIVVRYIKLADLVDDSRFLEYARVRGAPPKSVPSIEEGGVIVQLFAKSKYLQRAGLDWKEYYSMFSEDVREERYSQHGAAFLLTLLGDAESLTIPMSWEPNAATNQLLNVLVTEARQPSSLSSGLRSVTTFCRYASRSVSENRGLSWASPFLALPHLKSFESPGSFLVSGNPTSLAFRGSPYIAELLEAVDLDACCIDAVGITDFLKHAPRLKKLRYSHYTMRDFVPPDWDLCKFINAVAREAGSHLTELSVNIFKLRGTILPGKASTLGFQKLKKLEFPLMLATCNLNAAGVTGIMFTSIQRFFHVSVDPFVRDLIPTSVTHLSVKSDGMGPYDRGLDALFGNLGAVRRCQLPNLEEVFLNCKQGADEAYKQQCNKIVADGKEEGVAVHLRCLDYARRVNWE